jgi:hypothetical protein
MTGTPSTTAPACPRCGSPMVRAIAKTGSRTGQPLWRCSDFSCPSLINIDETDATPVAPVAGESAQARFERERLVRTQRLLRGAPLLAAVGTLLAVGSFFFALILFSDLRWAALGPVAVIALFLWLINRLPDEVVYWGKGAEGERRVGARLDSLKTLGFVTLYDRRLVGRGGNIDAVTVGPTGVYVVETKWRGRGVEIINGRLEVGGHEQPDTVRQVTDLAMLVQVSIAQTMNHHRLTVVPVICIANRKVEGGDRAGGVLVLSESTIAKRLADEPVGLTPVDVQELARLLDRALPAYERRSDATRP